jgi:hypothetical protein
VTVRQRLMVSGPQCCLLGCDLDRSTLLLGVTECRRKLFSHALTGFVQHVRSRGFQRYPWRNLRSSLSFSEIQGLGEYRLSYTPGARILQFLLIHTHLANTSSSGNENKRSTSCGIPWGSRRRLLMYRRVFAPLCIPTALDMLTSPLARNHQHKTNALEPDTPIRYTCNSLCR